MVAKIRSVGWRRASRGGGEIQGERRSTPGDTQLTLGWGTTPVSGVLNLDGRTKNAGGLATEQLAYFEVKLSRNDW